MATKSKAARVPATKVNFSNPDVFQLKHSFQPAKDREGNSQITFLGYEHSISKDGDNGFMKLVFSVRDITNQAPENIPILVNYNVSEGNKFGKVLEAMGCEVKPLEVEYDEDGFETAVGDADLSYIYTHLDECAGYMYKAAMTNLDDKPGLYRINIDTIVPFLDKEGNQRKVAAVEA